MSQIQEKREVLQETMNLLGAMASGIEQVVGKPANAMSYVAGKKLGKKFSASAAKTDDVEKALATAREVLQKYDCNWEYELFKPVAEKELIRKNEAGDIELHLIFRDCMIRQSLACYGHPQKQSLCYMMYGFFAGSLEMIMSRKAELEIIHAGENACLKRLRVLA